MYREKPGRLVVFSLDGELSRDFYSFLYTFFGIFFEFIKVMPTQPKDQGGRREGGGKSLCEIRLGSGWKARGAWTPAAASAVS